MSAAVVQIVIYKTDDDVPEKHRFVGYFYWPHGEVANVVFRGDDVDALRNQIGAFVQDQLDREASMSAKVSASREVAAAKRKATILAKKAGAA